MTTEPRHWHYRAFGLNIRSDVELCEMRPRGAVDPDIVFTFGRVDRPDPEMPAGRDHAFGADETYLGFAQIGKFLISGAEVVCDRWPALPLSLIGYSFLGPVMAAAMHARGHLILHGSALAIDGRAAVFLGDKGAGKSTTAGAMIAAGHTLVSDDVIAVSTGLNTSPTIEPAYPTIKVTEAALASYGFDEFTIIPNEVAGIPKLRARLHRDPPEHAVPISRIYLLQRGDADTDPEVVRLAPEEALPHLFEHSYMARYGTDAFRKPGAMAVHMEQCAALVRDVGVSRLVVPGRVERLGEAVALVERDVAAPR